MEPNMYKQIGTLRVIVQYCNQSVTANKRGPPTMSSGQSSSDFKSILDTALSEYEKKTGNRLFDDPLADKLQRCDSIDTLKAIFQRQAEGFQSKGRNERLMKWIGPTVDVLCTFSDTLGGVAGIVRH